MTDVSQPKFLNVDDLLDAVFSDSPTPCELVHVPELGVGRGGIWVEVRGMTGEEKAGYLEDITSGQEAGQAKTEMRKVNPAMLRAAVYAPAYDDNQQWLAWVSTTRIFEGRTDADINRLPGAGLDRITDVVARLAGFRRGDDDTVVANEIAGAVPPLPVPEADSSEG